MYLTNIDPKKTAILVIDMQNDFIKPGANIYSHMGYQMCDKLNEFLDINRQKGSLSTLKIWFGQTCWTLESVENFANR